MRKTKRKNSNGVIYVKAKTKRLNLTSLKNRQKYGTIQDEPLNFPQKFLISDAACGIMKSVNRRTAGGYHANTHAECMAILIIVHLIFVMIIRNISTEVSVIYTIVSMGVVVIEN